MSYALFSIDPGLRGCGLAVWKRKMLVRALYVPEDERDADAPWWAMVHALAREIGRDVCTYAERPELAIELPQVYDRSKSRGDPNDLIQLAALVGAVVARLALPTTVYLPREWKGTVPKDVMVGRIQSKLLPEEVARVELPAPKLRHNVWDAVGIGLRHLGRL